ncbi:uncharacterized protein LOC112687435 isoform X15 [Sipha flava]|uniref:Uncharacterized protein LOC112687435 isoform X15 n=1 Tax=Sipha flava TaxID=143950 RepID=A0A8B8FY77_9HEMI|nr:uncharacterized protein LOC112687435 isoform X15 [Sipha flava]
MLVETVSDAHVHFHYSARRFRDVLLANILANQNKNEVNNAGKAAKSGVREGFLIESINAASVDHLTSNEAQTLIKNCGDTLTIGVYRPSKTNNSVQNDLEHEAEAKACVDKSGKPKSADTETTNKKSKRIRKRRRKKKSAESSAEQLVDEQSKNVPVKITEQKQEQTQVIENPKIEIIEANSDLRVDELEWIKRNEALLIAELETRRQAGLPIQVVVRVEKITPSMPEYCQIVPDFCHLDVIKEEASASEEDLKKENRECSDKNVETNNVITIPYDWESSDVAEDNNIELNRISKANLNESVISECNLSRLESPSLVRESEILRFADIVSTENECVIELETLEPLKDLSFDVENVKTLETNECTDATLINNFNDEKNITKNYVADNVKINDKLEQNKNMCQTLNNNLLINCSREQNQLTSDTILYTDSFEESPYEDIYYDKSLKTVQCNNNQLSNFDASNKKGQLTNYSTSTELSHKPSFKKYSVFSKSKHYLKTTEVVHHENTEHENSSDDSTVKQYVTQNHKYKTRSQNKVSIYDKLKQIARLLQDDTDDYEEIQSPQTTSRCVSIASDSEMDSDWISFTLSDGESAKSLCLSPSQAKSGYAPSTVSETSEIIDLHKKFLKRTKSPNFSPYQDNMAVEILSYSDSPSPSPSKSYSSEVVDEACRMCGTSDEPLSDAECLVSLRKYRETRSRLLDVIQKEQHLNRSVIDRPSSMPTFIDTLSVPDNQTRERMYTEYMEKVKEREDRLHNKVIRITKACRPLSSGSLQALNDIDVEFVTKARERLEKLGVEPDVHIEVKEEYYPRHLVDIVPEEEVCIEEVQMNGVWSPELKHKSLDLENISRRVEKKSPPSELPPVWTPNASPTPERKTYKPIKFESPTLSRKKLNLDTQKASPKPPTDLPVLSPPTPPPPPALPLTIKGDENVHITDRKLPRVQSPTVTLLQKAREGQLPKGSAYLESEENNMNKENKIKGSTVKRNVETEEIKYTTRREYDNQSSEKKPKKMVEITAKKYEGIGPTTKEGVPIVLRSEIKEPNQPKWYKQMYESLHKFQSDDEGVTVRYKTLKRDSRARNNDGYLSEPEKGYDSDFAENRLFQNLDGDHSKIVSSTRRSASPVKCGQDRYKNQPRPIENYEPGHSSIAEKETKQWWEEAVNTFDENAESQIPFPQNRTSSKKSNMAQALKETGYDSDSTLIFKRQDTQSQCLSPTEQKTAYKVIQNGGEVPFQGLRKNFPERPKDSPHKYAESEVTLQYRRPVRNEIKEEWSEEDLANKQAEAMRRIYQEERRRKYLQELQDMSNRRHADNLLPSQKSPIPLNRYDDFLDETPQPPRSRTPEPKLVARALYNFVGQTSRELSFRKGDIIFVRKQIDKNWYEGEHNAMVGLFPFNYVEVIPYDGIRTTPHRPYEGQARAKFNFVAQTNMELSLVKGELVVLTRRVDNNWYEGRIGSKKGIFPVSYVTVLVEPGDIPNPSISASVKPVASPAAHSLITSNPPKTQHMYQPDSYSSMPTRNSGTQMKKQTNNINETLHVDVHSEPMPYRALYNYKPQNSDELELREGDVVFVMEKCDDGWYVGSSKRTGCFGTFPGNYVQRSI